MAIWQNFYGGNVCQLVVFDVCFQNTGYNLSQSEALSGVKNLCFLR